MTTPLDGKSSLTGCGVLTLYYILSLLGVGAPLAFAGAVISRSAAKREQAPVIIKHCTWITRTLWVGAVLMLLVLGGGMALIHASGLEIPKNFELTSFEQIHNAPHLSTIFNYVLGMAGATVSIFCWGLYRMLRGLCALHRGVPPKSL